MMPVMRCGIIWKTVTKVNEWETERGRDGRFVCPFRLSCSSVRFGDGESSQTPDSSSDPIQSKTRHKHMSQIKTTHRYDISQMILQCYMQFQIIAIFHLLFLQFQEILWTFKLKFWDIHQNPVPVNYYPEISLAKLLTREQAEQIGIQVICVYFLVCLDFIVLFSDVVILTTISLAIAKMLNQTANKTAPKW